MTAKTIMLQGTGSDVGKSLIAAGLCRAFVNQGLKVAPFKPQNMSNNAAVTADGGEIGRAQALQARASKIPASIHMNPVLLKPETTTGAQVVIHGKAETTLTARQYFKSRQQYLPAILDSFRQLTSQNDLVIIEGAGSPAEINLRNGDIANMGFAEAANIPVLLIGDIHRGGVIAAIAGTFQIISDKDAGRIKAHIINNFHGDIALFDEGRMILEEATGTPCLGIIPHFADAAKLPAEDAVALDKATTVGNGKLHICVPRLSRIANFDDLDPLKQEDNIRIDIIQPGTPVPASCDLMIIPGSKSTIADMKFIRQQGWDIDILAHARRGGHVLGLCGGFQMLGNTIADPDGVEGSPETVAGLGLLDITTTLTGDKTLTNVSGNHCQTGSPLSGYEIHIGQTTGPDCARPFARIQGKPEGASNGNITGTYLHGCFSADAFRARFLESLGAPPGDNTYDTSIETTLDGLAEHLAEHLDLEQILAIASQPQC
jgi:adenosylcobyric acid synthase